METERNEGFMNCGVIIIGPAGSGKSTFCKTLAELYTSIDRPSMLVNFDPGNEQIDYKANIDIRELITVEETQTILQLGFFNQTERRFALYNRLFGEQFRVVFKQSGAKQSNTQILHF